MASNERLRTRGSRRAARILAEFAVEIRHARIRAGLSQEEVGRRVGVSGDKIWKIEHERLPSLSVVDACEIGAVLGFDLAARLYPNGAPVRDQAQAAKLLRLLLNVGEPLSYRTDVALPQREGQPDMRAWDAVLSGHGERTGIELESRLTDMQATTRRHNLKRRDDAVDHFLLVVADTRHNRRVVREFAELLPDLPRLRTASVLRLLRAGHHPPTALILF